MLADRDQNVDILRRAIEEFNRRDFDAALAMVAEDCTWEPFLASTETPLLHGKAEIIAAWKSQVEVLDVRIESAEFLAPSEGTVITVANLHSRGAGSEISLDQQVALVATFGGDGRIQSMTSFASREEALANAGDPQ